MQKVKPETIMNNFDTMSFLWNCDPSIAGWYAVQFFYEDECSFTKVDYWDGEHWIENPIIRPHAFLGPGESKELIKAWIDYHQIDWF